MKSNNNAQREEKINKIKIHMERGEKYMTKKYVDFLYNNPDIANKLLSKQGRHERLNIKKGTKDYEALERLYYLSVQSTIKLEYFPDDYKHEVLRF